MSGLESTEQTLRYIFLMIIQIAIIYSGGYLMTKVVELVTEYGEA